MTGYGGSIRRVMEVREPGCTGIHGVVADLITVEKKYETAIETALGGSIQNIVTDSEQTAKRLIEYLKKNQLWPSHLPAPDQREEPPASFKQEGGIKGTGCHRPGQAGWCRRMIPV